MGELPEPSDADSIECHLQNVGMGSLICRAAKQESSRGVTNEVNPAICFNCPVGIIYREVGCDSVLPSIDFYVVGGGPSPSLQNLFCKRRKRNVDLDYCRACNIVTAETTKQIVTSTRGLFQSEEQYAAYKNLESARKDYRDGDYESSITQSIACLESVLRACHEDLGQPLPSKTQLAQLWTSARDILSMDKMDDAGATVELMNNLTGVVTSLGRIRNNFGDAHGKGKNAPETSAAMAELAMNTAATISTTVLRRLKQIEASKNGGPDKSADTN